MMAGSSWRNVASQIGESLEVAINDLPCDEKRALLCRSVKGLTAFESAAMEERYKKAECHLAEKLGYPNGQEPPPLYYLIRNEVISRMAIINNNSRPRTAGVREWFGSSKVVASAPRVAVATGLIMLIVAGRSTVPRRGPDAPSPGTDLPQSYLAADAGRQKESVPIAGLDIDHGEVGAGESVVEIVKNGDHPGKKLEIEKHLASRESPRPTIAPKVFPGRLREPRRPYLARRIKPDNRIEIGRTDRHEEKAVEAIETLTRSDIVVDRAVAKISTKGKSGSAG